ncbi:MAG: hypothetical protein ACLPVW_04485 [Terriglobales bacterium]|jgi:hypothetical protein
MWLRSAQVLLLLIGITRAGTWAQTIPQIGDIPPALPASQRTDLERQRSALLEQRSALMSKVAAHNQKCASVAEGSSLAGECAQSRSQLQTDKSAYIEAVTSFNAALAGASASPRAELEARIAELRKQIQLDQTAIRNLGFAQRAPEFEEWQGLAADSQKQFEEESREALIDFGLEGLSKTAGVIGAWNPAKANKMIARLQQAGITDPYALEAIRALGNLRGKPASAKEVKALIETIDKVRDLAAIDKNLGEETRAARLDAIATVVGWAQTSPELSLLVADLKFTSASLYNNAARRVSQNEVERLTALNESQLKALQKLSGVLSKHVDQLNEAKQQLAQLQQ